MELVTGRLGSDHISSADAAALYRGALIADDVVLADGDKLSCTMLDANTAEIGTGSCLLQAHHARIEVAEQVTIESGSVGFNRNDLIVARYTLGTGNIQTVYLAVIKGTATAGEATDPTYTSGDIDGGDVLIEFPLWRIPISGVSVGDPERIMPTIDTLQDQITSLGETLTQMQTRIGTLDALTFNIFYSGSDSSVRVKVKSNPSAKNFALVVGSMNGTGMIAVLSNGSCWGNVTCNIVEVTNEYTTYDIQCGKWSFFGLFAPYGLL